MECGQTSVPVILWDISIGLAFFRLAEAVIVLEKIIDHVPLPRERITIMVGITTITVETTMGETTMGEIITMEQGPQLIFLGVESRIL